MKYHELMKLRQELIDESIKALAECSHEWVQIDSFVPLPGYSADGVLVRYSCRKCEQVTLMPSGSASDG